MAANSEFLHAATKLIDAVARLAEASQFFAFAILLLPALPGVTGRSISGTIAGAALGIVSGMAAAAGFTLWAAVLWTAGFIVAWVLATKTEMRRDAKLRHAELLQAIKSTTRCQP